MSETRVYVSVIITNEASQYLILQRGADSRFAAGQWEFVNGSLESQETAEATAVREVSEETGLMISETDLQALPPCELTDSDGRWVVISFRAHVLDSDVRISGEHQAYRWVTEEELRHTPNAGEDYTKQIGG